MRKTFRSYIVDKGFNKTLFITRKKYQGLDWQNAVPELVCDILCYMVNYFHYRTDKFSRKVYNTLLTAQVKNKSAMSAQ